MMSHRVLLTQFPANAGPLRSAAFTLVELLAVMSIVLIMAALVIPAFNAITGAGDVTKAAYDLAGALELARTYALANNTYVWVGFYEDDETQSSPNAIATGKGGRVILSVVASRNGTRYNDAMNVIPKAFGSGDPNNMVALAQVNKLIKIDNVHMAALNSGLPSGATNPVRPPVASAYQVGDSSSSSPNNAGGPFALTTDYPSGNQTTFTYPVPPSATVQTTSPQYTFAKIIEFNPQGEASKITENTYNGAGPQSFMEIALQPTHGGAVAPPYAGTANAAAAIQIEGLSGQVKIYRP